MMESLTQQRKLIDDALKALQALDGAFEDGEPGKVIQPRLAPKPAGRARMEEPSHFVCEKHPNDAQFSKKGQCKLCHSEFMRDYWKTRRLKGNPKREQVATITAAAESPKAMDADSELVVFSHRQRCPKCGLVTRFRRPRNSRATDNWVCLGTGCELKVSYYKIAVDREYQPVTETAARATA
jgi:hypothetical protein